MNWVILLVFLLALGFGISVVADRLGWSAGPTYLLLFVVGFGVTSLASATGFVG